MSANSNYKIKAHMRLASKHDIPKVLYLLKGKQYVEHKTLKTGFVLEQLEKAISTKIN